MKNVLFSLLLFSFLLSNAQDTTSHPLSNYNIGDTILVRLVPGANAPYKDKFIQEVEILQGDERGSLVPMFCDELGIHNELSTRIAKVRVGYSFYTLYISEAAPHEQAWYNLILNIHKKYIND